MRFEFSSEKNEILKNERNISFEQIIKSIADNGVLLDFPHPNADLYPGQRIFVVEINDYTYCVPYVINKDIIFLKTIFLKTIFPSRKFMTLLRKENG